MKLLKECLGEALGTFTLVFIGCGSVALAALFGTFSSLLEVAIVWGVGVALAIFISRKWCPAHLNPAVSVAFFLENLLSITRLPLYILSQIIGAFLASAVLYIFIQDELANYEFANDLVRGEVGSHVSAVMFGEFFPNPGFSEVIKRPITKNSKTG